VKKKTLQVLLSWQEQFKDDPGMVYVSRLYKSVKPDQPKRADPAVAAEQRRRQEAESELRRRSAELEAREKRLREQQEAKEAALVKERERQERMEKARKEEETRKAAKNKNKGKPAPKRKWDYEKEKPLILQSIAAASQSSSNLVNAITVRGCTATLYTQAHNFSARQHRERQSSCEFTRSGVSASS
jgi:LAS seventeen-binding protein 5